MSKVKVATISITVDKSNNEIRTTIEGSKNCRLDVIGQNLAGLLEGMVRILEINPDAVFGGQEFKTLIKKEEVSNG